MVRFNDILIIGNGGRECAMAYSIKKDNPDVHLYYFGNHSNPGLELVCDAFYKYQLTSSLEANIKNLLEIYSIQLAVVGPESFLADGIVDILMANQVQCIGPTQNLSFLETSKFFTRNKLKNIWGMNKYNPRFCVFSSDITSHSQDKKLYFILEEYMDIFGGFVVKENGLCGGKGVKVSGEHFNSVNMAFEYCKKLLKMKKSFIIEEKLVGKEFSLMSFSDGTGTLKSMPIVKDYKRAYDDDMGPNTGGMGSVSMDNHRMDFLSEDDVQLVHKINSDVIRNLQIDIGIKYIGIIYGSFMKLANGNIKIIEYNCRFGDPECINVLSLLQTNLLEVFYHMVHESLDSLDISWAPLYTICKYLVPEGYPLDPVRY